MLLPPLFPWLIAEFGFSYSELGLLVFSAGARGIELQFAGQRTRAAVYAQGEVDHIFTPLGATQITAIDLLAHAGEAAAEGGRLTAPMPGQYYWVHKRFKTRPEAQAS
eukprot:gene46456-57929_t